MIILGIDPGTNRIGFGAIKKLGNRWCHLKSGLIEISKDIKKINGLPVLDKKINELLVDIRPDKVGVEKIFFSKNRKTAIEVAQARGVILNAVLKKKIALIEMTPSEIKLIAAGHGRATKKAVAKMVSLTIGYPKTDQIDDITDALAIAIAASTKKSYV